MTYPAARPRDRRIRSASSRLVALTILGIGLLLAPRSLLAAPDDSWDARFYANGTNIGGLVDSIVVSGGNVYVAGLFSSMFDVSANNVARWDGTAWSSLGVGTNGRVIALAIMGGDLYAAGEFTTAGGSPASRVARWNGTSWSALGAGVNSTVRALAASGSTLYAGGHFTTAGGSPANAIAQWNGTTWSALGTGMNSTPVRALAVIGTDLYAGGNFTTAGGTAANRIARWDGTSWSALSSGMNNQVVALTTDGTDLYAGGLFSTAGGTGVNFVARWNGSTWSSLGTGMNNEVLALAVIGGNLYAEGGFSTAGGVPASRIARWDGASWSALGTGFTLINGFEFGGALAGVGSDVWVGAQFTGAGGIGAVNIARWTGSAWAVATTTPGQGMGAADFYPGVRALARSSSGDLYATGVFEFAGTTPAISIVKFDGTSWSALGTGLEGTNFANYGHGFGEALAFYGVDLYVGGNFATAGGVTVNHIARWNGSSFTALGTGVGGGQVTVDALIEYNGELYVGGSFSTVNGSPLAGLARWNGSTWSAVGSGVNGAVTAFAILGSDLYVGGSFSTAGGNPASNVARWNGTTWSAVGSGPGGTPNVLAAVGSDLYAGGAFGSGSAIMKWDGATWSIPGGGICWFCGFGGHFVQGLAALGNDLYVGGSFDVVGSPNVSASGIAKWNGVSWSALGSGIGGCVGSSCPFPGVGPVLAAGTDVYVGGRFTYAGKTASFISIWHTCGNGVVEANEQCDDGNTTNGDCCSATCQYESGGNSCPDDGNPCTNDQCNGAGGCTHPPNSAPCDDSVYCNGSDVCSGGTCLHTGDPCPGPDGDGNCSESCDEATDSCTGYDPNGSACTDGLHCNGTDTCSGGACAGHTGDPCPGPDGDGNCAESCDEGSDTCTAPDPDGSSCTDGTFCNGADTCSGGACAGHAGDPCVGAVECANVCNEVLDNCLLPGGTPCTDDGNACTDDQCNGAGSCTHPNNSAPCDDGIFCNGADVCAGGTCSHAGNPCTGGPECADTCNEGADNCFDATGTTCTPDTNQCTLDQCNGAGACVHPNAPDGTACTDGDPCTSGEDCTAGVCGGGTPNPAGCIDHYLCYKMKVTSTEFAFLPATLADQFETTAARVYKPKSFCAPANKNGEGVLDAVTHEESHPIKTDVKHTRRLNVEVIDQFGTLRIDTLKADRLLVPTNKGLGSPPPAVSSTVDHYTCYKVKITAGTPKFPKGVQATVATQFETRLYDVKKPKRLCAPVDKNGEGVTNSSAHLMCYQVKVADLPKLTPVVGVIHTQNQLGAGRLDTQREEELCVPAVKNL
jgi:hypothetical protein